VDDELILMNVPVHFLFTDLLIDSAETRARSWFKRQETPRVCSLWTTDLPYWQSVTKVALRREQFKKVSNKPQVYFVDNQEAVSADDIYEFMVVVPDNLNAEKFVVNCQPVDNKLTEKDADYFPFFGSWNIHRIPSVNDATTADVDPTFWSNTGSGSESSGSGSESSGSGGEASGSESEHRGSGKRPLMGQGAGGPTKKPNLGGN